MVAEEILQYQQCQVWVGAERFIAERCQERRSGRRRVKISEAHGRSLKLTAGNGAVADLAGDGVPRIDQNPGVHIADHALGSFEDLQKLSILVQQHSSDANVASVQRALLLQRRQFFR